MGRRFVQKHVLALAELLFDILGTDESSDREAEGCTSTIPRGDAFFIFIPRLFSVLRDIVIPASALLRSLLETLQILLRNHICRSIPIFRILTALVQRWESTGFSRLGTREGDLAADNHTLKTTSTP